MWSVKHFADSFDAFLLSTHQFRAGAGNLYRAATGVQKQVYKEIKINTEKNWAQRAGDILLALQFFMEALGKMNSPFLV